MNPNLNFTPQDWERIKHDWTAWWHHELDRPMVVVDVYEWQGKSFIPQHGGWDVEKDRYPIAEILDYYQDILENVKFYGDSWPRWWPNFGAGIVAGFLGAQVSYDENTVWFEPRSETDLKNLQPNYDADNFWWRWVKDTTQSAIDRWDDQITVATTDLGGNLDILASLRGTQNLLMDLLDRPEEVDRQVAEITQLWLRYHDELFEIIQAANNGTTSWAPMWCPGRYYMLQSDFCYMISPDMFERFVLPDLEACCSHLDYGFYHLDGKGQIPHLDMLLGIENLRGIQWIPGDGAPPPEQWLLLLKRIRDGGKLCQVYVSAQGALTIARELSGKGFTFMITDPPPEEEIKGLLKTLGVQP
jgi:5-methyltetrahydrofolate--homocysteine methyltransferase